MLVTIMNSDLEPIWKCDIRLPLIRNIVTDTRLVPIGNSVTNTNIKYIESANKKEILIIYLRMLHMQQIHVTKQVLHTVRDT